MFSCVMVDQIVIKYTLDVANFYSNTQRNSDFGQCYLYTVVERNYSYGPLGCCDIEKISNIDIEKKIPVISIFSIFFCFEIIGMKLGFLFTEKH